MRELLLFEKKPNGRRRGRQCNVNNNNIITKKKQQAFNSKDKENGIR